MLTHICYLPVCCVENGGYSKQNGIKALQVSSCPTFLPQRATDVFNVSWFAAIY